MRIGYYACTGGHAFLLPGYVRPQGCSVVEGILLDLAIFLFLWLKQGTTVVFSSSGTFFFSVGQMDN